MPLDPVDDGSGNWAPAQGGAGSGDLLARSSELHDDKRPAGHRGRHGEPPPGGVRPPGQWAPDDLIDGHNQDRETAQARDIGQDPLTAPG